MKAELGILEQLEEADELKYSLWFEWGIPMFLQKFSFRNTMTHVETQGEGNRSEEGVLKDVFLTASVCDTF